MADVKSLKSLRKVIKTHLSNLRKQVDAYNPDTITRGLAEYHLEKINRHEAELSDNFNKIVLLIQDDEFDDHSAYYEEVEKNIGEMKQ
ncbi:unnamed protein product, partial [Allacma fusca]